MNDNKKVVSKNQNVLIINLVESEVFKNIKIIPKYTLKQGPSNYIIVFVNNRLFIIEISVLNFKIYFLKKKSLEKSLF